MNTEAAEKLQNPRKAQSRRTEDKVVTAEVPPTESTMTTTSIAETTMAENSERKKRSPLKLPAEKMECPSRRTLRDSTLN